MTQRGILSSAAGTVAFVAGTTLALAAAAPGRPPKGATRPNAQQGDTDLVFCVASNRTLYAAQHGACPSAQQRVEVEAPSEPLNDCRDCGSQKPASSDVGPDKAHNKALAGLEQRIDALHRSPLFTVVDPQKRPMMAVKPGALLVYDEGGSPVATMRADVDGGSITASSSGGLAATLGTSNIEAGLRITDQNVLRLRLNGQAGGTYAFAVPTLGASGSVVGIGESKAATGTIIVGSPSGATKASLAVSDGKGVGGIFNGTGLSILSLTEGASAGGLLALGNAQSEPRAKMGVKNDRYGVVLTGPGAGFPLVTGSGLPGSYILGCAPGPACEP